MIAGRRARQRPLLRHSAMKAAIARNLSVVDGTLRRHIGKRHVYLDGTSALSQERLEPLYIPPLSYSSDSLSQPASSMKYLQQLSTLHTAGILTDEEFLTAKGRLLGS